MVQDLLIKGFNQTQIANSLKVSEFTISKDIDFLRVQSREHTKEHLENVLPSEYEKCMAGERDFKSYQEFRKLYRTMKK